MGSELPTMKQVEAERFVLKDPSGRTRAELGIADDTPGLVLFDGEGVVRAKLLADPDGPTNLTLCDPSGEPRIGLVVLRDSQELVLLDAARMERVRLTLTADGAHIALLDEKGNVAAELP